MRKVMRHTPPFAVFTVRAGQGRPEQEKEGGGEPPPERLKEVPEELVVDLVVILNFGGLDESAEVARTAVGGGAL